ncbi:MAG: hypothetical protein E7Y34_02895, partial [Mycoplasma sp.]|nr:hypothetical protein [Mycoplasma sp.]
MVSTFPIDDKHLGDLNSFLSTKKAQFIHPIVSESQDEVNDEAVERAKKIKMKGLDYIYPVFDNAEAFYKDDAKDNHLKLVGAIASTASRWDFSTSTGTIHGKVLNGVLPVNVTQASFTKLINSGCAMYTNRKGAS